MPYTLDPEAQDKAQLKWGGIMSQAHHDNVQELIKDKKVIEMFNELPDDIDISDYSFKLAANREAQNRNINIEFIGSLDLVFHYLLFNQEK